MRKYSTQEALAGEQAVKALSDKAQTGYAKVDPLKVYAYTDNGDNTRYSVHSAFGDLDNMTLSELEAELEYLADLV